MIRRMFTVRKKVNVTICSQYVSEHFRVYYSSPIVMTIMNLIIGIMGG